MNEGATVPVTKVLVYECISGGGLGDGDAALLAQGVAMRDAIAADLLRVPGVAVSCVASRSAPLPAALAGTRAIDGDGRTPAELLAREAPRHDRVWVVAPECDGLLAALAASIDARRWLGCTPPAIRVAASKSATRGRLAAAGIAVPASWRAGEPAPAGGGAWIVKPDDGAGCVDTVCHASFAAARDDLATRLARGAASTLEAWIDGIPLSLSVLCRGGRAELLSINRQRIAAAPGGPVRYHGVDIGVAPLGGPAGRRLAGLAQRIVTAVPGLSGYVGVDVVWRGARPGDALDAGEPFAIEINPRVTCAYAGLSAALGRNLAGEILSADHATPVPHALH